MAWAGEGSRATEPIRLGKSTQSRGPAYGKFYPISVWNRSIQTLSQNPQSARPCERGVAAATLSLKPHEEPTKQQVVSDSGILRLFTKGLAAVGGV